MGEHPLRLSLAYRALDTIHPKIAEKFGPTIIELDLSNNKLSSVSELRIFRKLETIILDNNEITAHTKFPPLPTVRTLWVNNNNISNLATFIDHIKTAMPNLEFLSMLNNEACPNFFNSGTLAQYNDYRYYVISKLGKLKTLDSSPVSSEERREALRLYGSTATVYTPEIPKVDSDGNLVPKTESTDQVRVIRRKTPSSKKTITRRKDERGSSKHQNTRRKSKNKQNKSRTKKRIDPDLPSVHSLDNRGGDAIIPLPDPNEDFPPISNNKTKSTLREDESSEWSTDSEDGEFVFDVPDSAEWLEGDIIPE